MADFATIAISLLALGEYSVDVFAEMVGEEKPRLLATANVTLTEEMAEMLTAESGGVMFNWNPNTNAYKPEGQATKIDFSATGGPRLLRTAQ